MEYCDPRAPLKNSDYFPPSLIEMPMIQSNLSMPKWTSISSEGYRLPSALEYVYGEHFGLPVNIKFLDFTEPVVQLNNNLKVANLAHSNIMDTFPPVSNMWQLQILDLSDAGLKSIKNEVIDSFKDCIHLRYLNLSHNQFFNTDFQNTLNDLTELIALDLSGNRITALDPQAFTYNHKLKELLLRNNLLESNLHLQLPQQSALTLLDLSGNSLQYLAHDFTSELDMLGGQLVVNLTTNKFKCDCSAISFIKWLKRTVVNIVDQDHLKCFHANKTFKLMTYPTDSLEEQCNTPDNSLQTSSIAIGVSMLVMIIVLMGLLYRYRWPIRWHYYNIKRSLRGKKQTDGLDLIHGKPGPEYDAYVVFNDTEDSEFVFQTLRPPLEDVPPHGCRLFLHGRDDIPGVRKAENVIDGMKVSKYVLLVVSPHFTEDGENDFAFHMALIGGMNRLIVLLKKFSDLTSMTEPLRALMKPSSGIPIFEWPADQQGQKLVLSQLKLKISG